MAKMHYDEMPPLSVPYRFFLSAPVFAIVVGLLLISANPGELASRWTPLMLGATHGLTLGFMLSVMLGALFQILPVIAGISVPQPKRLATVVHLFLIAGASCLTLGFILSKPLLLGLGGCCVFMALASFFAALVRRLLGVSDTPTTRAIRLALLSLVVTLVMGLIFVMGWVEPATMQGFRLWTNIHLMWGLMGWVLLLVMGVSFVVVPMFYVAPNYPKWLSERLPLDIFAQLVILSFAQSNASAVNALLILLSITISAFPIATLRLFIIRKRKIKDTTILFWQTAMVAILLALVLLIASFVVPADLRPQVELLMSSVVVFGFVLALITGMLYKIVPFLVWQHLQKIWMKNPGRKMPINTMAQIIGNRAAKIQFWLFIGLCIGVFALMAGFEYVWLVRLTGIMLTVCYGFLLVQLVKAGLLCRRLSLKMNQPV